MRNSWWCQESHSNKVFCDVNTLKYPFRCIVARLYYTNCMFNYETFYYLFHRLLLNTIGLKNKETKRASSLNMTSLANSIALFNFTS